MIIKNSNTMKRLIIMIIAVVVAVSCCQSNVEYVEQFPFSEEDLIEKNLGVLLEYAIFDSTKIDFVKSILCDSICKNQNLTFCKTETVINNCSYFFFDCRMQEVRRSDYPGILWLDINNMDSLRNNFGVRYGINDIDIIIEELAEFNKTSIDEVIKSVFIKQCEIGNVYIPYLIYIVSFDSFNCEDGFVEKVILVNKTINKVMDAYSEKKFPNEKIIIRPLIEIRTLLLPPPRY